MRIDNWELSIGQIPFSLRRGPLELGEPNSVDGPAADFVFYEPEAATVVRVFGGHVFLVVDHPFFHAKLLAHEF